MVSKLMWLENHISNTYSYFELGIAVGIIIWSAKSAIVTIAGVDCHNLNNVQILPFLC